MVWSAPPKPMDWHDDPSTQLTAANLNADESYAALVGASVVSYIESAYGRVVPSGDITGATDTSLLQSVFQNGGLIQGGIYYINATLIAYSGAIVQAIGGEVIIQAAANLNAPLLQSNGFAGLTLTGSNTGGISNFTWRGRLTLDGNKANQSGTAAAAVQLYAYNFRIDTLTIRNCKAIDGLYTEWGLLGSPAPDNAMEAIITGLRIHDNTLSGAAWHCRGPHDTQCDKVIIHNNTTGASGLWVETNSGATVAAGSNGVDVTTFTGAGVLNLSTTLNLPSAGTVTVPTSTGTATLTYTGTSGGTQLTGVTRTVGTGTLATGAAITGPQYSGAGLLIALLHVWGQHSVGVLADAQVQLIGAQLEGAVTGQALVRGNEVEIHGGRIFAAGSVGYGLTLGDTVNKAVGTLLGKAKLYGFAGTAAASAAINFANHSSGDYSALIYQPTGQAIWGGAANNEHCDFSFAGGTAVPTVAALANLGTGAPAPTLSNASDKRGQVNIGTGTGPVAGDEVAITYAQPKASNALPVVSAANQATAALAPYVSVSSATGFRIGFANAPAASQATTAYIVTYNVGD